MIHHTACRILAPILVALTLIATPARADTEPGVNLHLGQPGYHDAKLIAASLDQLGIHFVRIGIPTPFYKPGQPVQFYKITTDVADTGVTFDLVANGHNNPESEAAHVALWARRYPGAIKLVEGPNEVNNAPVTLDGVRDKDSRFAPPLNYYWHYKATIAWMKRFYAAMKADPVTRDIPVAGVVGLPGLEIEDCDLPNAHVYAKATPGASLIAVAKAVRASAGDTAEVVAVLGPTKPRGGGKDIAPPHPGIVPAITELGNTTTGLDRATAEATQTRIVIDGLNAAERMRVRFVMLYQLFDGWPDTSAKQNKGEMHYGLFHNDGTPKPVAAAVRNWVGAP